MRLFFLLALLLVNSLCFSMEQPEDEQSKPGLWTIKNVIVPPKKNKGNIIKVAINVDMLNKMRLFNDENDDVVAELLDCLSRKVEKFYEGKKKLSEEVTLWSNFQFSNYIMPYRLMEDEHDENILHLIVDNRPYEYQISDSYKEVLEKYGTVQLLTEKLNTLESQINEKELKLKQLEKRESENSILSGSDKTLKKFSVQHEESKSNLSKGQVAEKKDFFESKIEQNKNRFTVPDVKSYSDLHQYPQQDLFKKYPYLGHVTALCIGIAGTLMFTKLMHMPSLLNLAKKIKLSR